MTRVKICGIVRPADAQAAVAAGADAIGFVLDDSPRRIDAGAVRSILRGLPPFVRTVGVFRRTDLRDVPARAAAAGVDVVQMHGDEPAPRGFDAGRPLIRRFRVLPGDTAAALAARLADFDGASALLDPGAGSGVAFGWDIARGLPGTVIVAGGLTPDNVARAIRLARPYAVDVSSGVEDAPGIKNAEAMRAFVAAVRSEDARMPA